MPNGFGCTDYATGIALSLDLKVRNDLFSPNHQGIRGLLGVNILVIEYFHNLFLAQLHWATRTVDNDSRDLRTNRGAEFADVMHWQFLQRTQEASSCSAANVVRRRYLLPQPGLRQALKRV